MKLCLLINSYTLICLWILVFPIGIIEISTSRKSFFDFLYVPYMITDLQAPETLLHIPRGETGTMWKTCFSAPQNAKKEISWNLITMSVTDFLLRVRSSCIKDYTFHDLSKIKRKSFILISIKKMKIWKFFLQITWFLNTR